jgi:hypothetical protein
MYVLFLRDIAGVPSANSEMVDEEHDEQVRPKLKAFADKIKIPFKVPDIND